jgi:hypothetical protein
MGPSGARRTVDALPELLLSPPRMAPTSPWALELAATPPLTKGATEARVDATSDQLLLLLPPIIAPTLSELLLLLPP